ncbi:hypothetical protein [Streptomyces tsukubensis]|uniref:DUF1273 domain-containing protein n=1 Tax=Streptomyces tsukubensis TaxID=83656 RepID=A0A1V4AEK5_9ACTN|nr:hypothetical protein [Streptomyces tsukubensis]OON82033.1 hypothetical protein B1H18_02910 [Streptomyces tsukubensis]QFR92518.1 hypothetical protein GBW32_04935 [Streptomyces tsukubensis]
MTVYAVTGHMDLTDDSVALVRETLRELLTADAGDLVGVSCIAAGSDSVFAEELLAAAGRLIVVLPSQNYRDTKVTPEHAAVFDHLVESATEVIVMPHESANRAAYEAANAELLRRGDRLVAVWDGTPPSGKGGGTADTVGMARAQGLEVEVVWPEGAVRRH